MLTLEDIVAARRQRLDDLADRYEAKPASQYRSAVLEAVELARDCITDSERALQAEGETWQRAHDRQARDLERARSLTALAELRAVPKDDDSLVRVTLEPPTDGGWRVGHLQELYLRFSEAGAPDEAPLDWTQNHDLPGQPRASAVVQNPNTISLVMPAIGGRRKTPPPRTPSGLDDLQDQMPDRPAPTGIAALAGSGFALGFVCTLIVGIGLIAILAMTGVFE